MSLEDLPDNISLKELLDLGIPLVDPRVIEGVDAAILKQKDKRREGQPPTKYEKMLIIFQKNLDFELGDTDITDEIIPLFEGYSPTARWAAQNRIIKLNDNVLESENVRIVRVRDDIYRPAVLNR